MKKIIAAIIAVLLMVCSASGAENTAALTELNLSTVGGIFNWGDSFGDVNALLSRYDLNIDADEENGIISVMPVSEYEQYSYDFYFNDETAGLSMIDCFSVIDGEISTGDVMLALNEAYGLSEMKKYKDAEFTAYISDFESGAVFADSKTIIAIGFTNETEETYGTVEMLLTDRQYWEAE